MKPAGLLLGLILVACSAPPSDSVAAAPTPSATATASASPTPRPTVRPTPEPRLDAEELAALVDASALREHLEALQAIADATPAHNRATGTAGFAATVEYVARVLTTAGYTVEEQPFDAGGVSSTNLIAERRGHGPGVVMVGAHLDSVPAGPGINDNGSGVAALLVLATALRELPDPDRTVRIAFWGAEEGGPFGSAAYVAGLTDGERGEIRAYLNFDMLGSTNAVRFVYDEDDAPPGSEALTALIGSRVEAAGLPWTTIDVDRRSDHGPFAAAGVPISGLFSGGRELVTDEQAATFGAVAGQPSDPCSDARCDTIDNVDLQMLARHARIIAEVVASLAASD